MTDSLQLLTPELFRTLVEGYKDLNVSDLQRGAILSSGYTADTPVVRWFWEVVHAYDLETRCNLLEFVTGSRRVPVSGARNLRFEIEKVDWHTGKLPGSATCFGKIHLPEYESKEKLKEKLDIALQNSIGFGAV